MIVTALFTVEYVLRIATARRKLAYVFSFSGLIDLAAILPFYFAAGVDMRGVRAIRILRVFRILKLVRYTVAIGRLNRAIVRIKEELVLFSVATAILMYVAALVIYYCEHEAQPETFKSVFHSLWWAVASLTTVGYGDMYPITPVGRIFTFVILLLGLGFVAVPSALLAAAFSKDAGSDTD